MIEMSPFYSHESAVGPVFDVATWSRSKTWFMAVIALAFGLVLVTAMILAWKPALLLDAPPEIVADIHQETKKLAEENPWAAYSGSAVVGLLAFFALAAACASTIDAVRGGHYFRVGPGGISLRVPHGLDFSRFCLVFEKLELDLPMHKIDDWTVVQHKQFGSTSRNSGNVTAFLKIQLTDGTKQEFNLDCFREPASVIHSKINDALHMVPAQFGSDKHVATAEFHAQTATAMEARYDLILDALSAMVGQSHSDSAVVVTHEADENCVQFILSNEAIVLDLPKEMMNADVQARATDYFQRVLSGSEFDGTAGFQARAANAQDAAQLALEVFDHVYQIRQDMPLHVELVSL